MSAGKVIVMTVVVLGSLASVVLLTLVCITGCGRWDPVYLPKRPLKPSDLPAIEEAIGLDLPGIEAVKYTAILHGKDTSIYFILEVPEDDVGKLIQTVKARSESVEFSDAFPAGIDYGVPGFQPPPESKVTGAFRDRDFYYAFCEAENGSVVVFMRTYGMTMKEFPKAFYDIFPD